MMTSEFTVRLLSLALLALSAATPALAQQSPQSPLTPQEQVAILCSDRISVLQDGLVAELGSATGAREAAINADYAALAKLSDAFKARRPAYPDTPDGKRKLEAQVQLLANDVVAKAAYERWDQGDRAPLFGMIRRCEMSSGAKVLGPTFGTW